MERVASKICKVAMAVLLTLVLAACGGEAASNPPSTPNPNEPGPSEPGPDDPYADPETPPPAPVAEPTVMASGSLKVSDAAQSLVTLNVAGFGVEAASLRAASLGGGLEAEAFTLVESGKVQGIKVKSIEAGDAAPADIAFVIDTTSSMGEGLASIQDTIINFSETLKTGGLDVRLGAVTFGDAFDTLAFESGRSGTSLSDLTPPSFDRDERPSLALTGDFETFQTFIAEDSPRGGSDTPENILGALSFAHERLAWREGAQRILVVVTDTCSHTKVSDYFIDEPWRPTTFEEVLGEVRAKASVHVIGGEDCRKFGGTLDMRAFTGVEGTGGLFYEWTGGDFSLVDIGLTDIVTSDYLITYKGELDGEEKDVRLVVDDGDAVRGEFTLKATY